MSQAAIVIGLAVRELWMTFRLVALLVAFVGGAAIVTLVPAPLPTTTGRLAIALAAASAVAAGIAAWSIAEERARGRAGWLVSRSVPRGIVLGGWFAAVAGPATAGALVGIGLAGIAAASVGAGVDGALLAVLGVAVASHAAAGVALGLALGAVMRRGFAAPIAAELFLVAALAAWLVPGVGELLPAGAFALLAGLTDAGTTFATAARSAGVGLLLVAALLAAARYLVERAEL